VLFNRKKQALKSYQSIKTTKQELMKKLAAIFFLRQKEKTKQKHLKKTINNPSTLKSMTQKKKNKTTTLPKNARIEKNQNQKMESETEIIQIIVLLKYPNNDVLLLR